MKPTDRSAYVHLALRNIPNRFDLCRHAAKATRALHTPERSIAQTTNIALTKVRRTEEK